MAKCKYCHEVISRLDKEVCPFCGGIKPLDGTDTSTQDVTKVIDQLENPVKITHKKRIITALLAIILGFTGAHYFYLGKAKKGLICLLVCLALIGGIGAYQRSKGSMASRLATAGLGAGAGAAIGAAIE